jgi:hypothetical protein
MAKRTRELKVKQDLFTSFALLISNIIHTIGILGTVVLVLIYLILFRSTENQQHEIVDKWILLKADCAGQNFGIKLILLLAAMFIIQQYYYVKKRKLDRLEIDRLSAIRNKYQESKLGKNLHHS